MGWNAWQAVLECERAKEFEGYLSLVVLHRLWGVVGVAAAKDGVDDASHHTLLAMLLVMMMSLRGQWMMTGMGGLCITALHSISLGTHLAPLQLLW